MNSNKINILFVIASSRIRKDNRASLMGRLTYNKTRKTFATGLFINPDHWNSKQQLIKPPEPDSELINSQVSLIKTKLSQAFLMLQVQENDFTVEDIYKTYKGEKIEKDYDVAEFFERYLKRLKTLIGIDIEQVTWNKHLYVKNDIKCFIKWKYKSNDLPLKKLEADFLTELDYYFKTQQKIKQVTINKKIQRFRKVIKAAVAVGCLDKDPFSLYKPGKVRKEVVFLSTDELQILEKHHFIQPRLQLVKDLFIFCCYTGLAYHEMSNLKNEHIIKGFDGNEWIQMKRKKTNKMISIPLLPKAKAVLDKYDEVGEYALPKFSNQKINSYLKEIGGIVGINKSISHHMARKTFASTVLLYNDVPMEIVSELLGHSSIKITQGIMGKLCRKELVWRWIG